MPVFVAGSTMRARRLEIALDHRLHGAGQRRHDRAQDDSANARPIETALGEETVDEQPELVRRAVSERLQTPAAHERRLVEDAEHDVRVTDVNGQQHRVSDLPGQFAGDHALVPTYGAHEQRSVLVDSSREAADRAGAATPGVQVTRVPRLDGDRRRHASRIASNRPANRSSYLDASAASDSAATAARSTARPSSVSSDVVRSSRSTGTDMRLRR